MTKQQILENYFGYSNFRPGQELLIDAILSGQDVLGIMPTGAGKSICYQVPALMLSGITVVISPLISLMKDQVQALNQAGIHAAYINSSLTENQISKAMQLAANGQYKIIYVAPERLETYDFIRFAEVADISMVTVDEAHCISQWGQDFRPSYLKIVRFIEMLAKRPRISAFTATATETVKEDIVCVLGLNEPKVLVTGFDRENLYFGVEMPKKKDKYVLDYVTEHRNDSGIIYCATRKNVDAVYDKLVSLGICATKYHAGLGNEERKNNQENFIYDRIPVIVATNAFGMGIDKSNVRYVIHYNMPQSLENYYQEAGRAGRDGEPAECVLLYSAQDVIINRFLIENKETGADVPTQELQEVKKREEERLRTMNYYCLTKDCLRTYILQYFGEHGSGNCKNCSNCLKEFEELDVTEESKKILQCVMELRQRYGINVIAGTLRGDNRAKLREYNVSRYESYGALKEMPENLIKQIMNQMILEKVLYVTKDKYSVVKAGTKARDLLNGQYTLMIKRVKNEEESLQSVNTANPKKNRRLGKSDILNGRGLKLFDALRLLRTTIAREEGIPPYLVFSDKTLVDMCVKLPFIQAEMMNVLGVGDNKYKKYGERFIAEIKSFTNGIKEKLYFGELDEAVQSVEGKNKKEKALPEKEKSVFYLTKEQAAGFSYREKYLVTELAEQLSSLRNPDEMRKLTGAEIFRYIQSKGMADEKVIGRRRQKIVYEIGALEGLYLGLRISKTGKEYEDIYYDERAQKMIVEHYTK